MRFVPLFVSLIGGVWLSQLSPALAQQNPLVGGHWMSTSRSADPADSRGYAYDLRYQSDGRVILVLAVANGVTTETFNYRLLGTNSYEAVGIDYAPRSLPPLIQPGIAFRCDFVLETVSVMDLNCHNGDVLRYTRYN